MYQKQCAECKTMLPVDAHFCIECRAPQIATGATERLTRDVSAFLYNGSAWDRQRANTTERLKPQSLEERALCGDGDMYVTRAEYHKILEHTNTRVAFNHDHTEEIATLFLGRRIKIAE
jgi:hypothetical protein